MIAADPSNRRNPPLKYKRLGNTGLRVSPLCLGCMTYGVPDRGQHAWTLDEATSRPMLQRAVELGINFFDTANSYSDGTSEEIVGRALRDFAKREEVVIATKVFFPSRKAPNIGGLSAQGHPHRDRRQPAASSAPTTSTCTRSIAGTTRRRSRRRSRRCTTSSRRQGALHRRVVDVRVAVREGPRDLRARRLDTLATMQNHLNLINREEEREMLPLCADAGVGVIPWSPLARGRLHARLGLGERAQRDRRVRPHAVPAAHGGRRPGRGRAVGAWPRPAACRARKSRWRGSCGRRR